MTKERKMTREDIERLLAMLVLSVQTEDGVKDTYDYVVDELASVLTPPAPKRERAPEPKVPCMLLANDPADW